MICSVHYENEAVEVFLFRLYVCTYQDSYFSTFSSALQSVMLTLLSVCYLSAEPSAVFFYRRLQRQSSACWNYLMKYTLCWVCFFFIFRKCVLWFSSRSIWKCWRMDSIMKPLTASVTKWPHSNLTLSMCASWARKPSGSLIYYLRNKMNPKEIIRLCSSDFTIYVRWLVVQG